MISADNFDFSFAGLKTAALYWLRDNTKKRNSHYILEDVKLNDFCASFEQAAVDVLAAKTKKALKMHAAKTLIVGGGVSANKKLRNSLEHISKTIGSGLLAPDIQYCMDNAAMIAVAGAYRAEKKQFVSWNKIDVNPNATIY
jgi:N6-L-threonylcarbamoyladenine synthase